MYINMYIYIYIYIYIHYIIYIYICICSASATRNERSPQNNSEPEGGPRTDALSQNPAP